MDFLAAVADAAEIADCYYHDGYPRCMYNCDEMSDPRNGQNLDLSPSEKNKQKIDLALYCVKLTPSDLISNGIMLKKKFFNSIEEH